MRLRPLALALIALALSVSGSSQIGAPRHKSPEKIPSQPVPIDPLMPVFPVQGHSPGPQVNLQVEVGEDGSVRRAVPVGIAQGQTYFMDSAVDAVRKWRFKPGMLNGKPVAATTIVGFEFRAPGDVLYLRNVGIQERSLPPRPFVLRPPLTEPVLERKVAPIYPPLAKKARVQGAVVLMVVIGTDGKVRSAKVISGHPLLTGAALDAVRQWEYKPYLVNGNPVQIETQVTIKFEQ